MNLTLTSEQELLADTARQFLAQRCPASEVRAIADSSEGYSSELWAEIAELGWLGLALPEEHGGAGAGFLDLCLLLEEIGGAQLPSPLVTTVVSCALPLARSADAERSGRLLARVAGGQLLMSFVDGMPGVWASGGDGVVADTDGEQVRLRGEALLVPYASVADELLVVAPGDGGPVAVLVDPGAEGLSMEPVRTVGLEPCHRVRFEDVAVERSALLADGDRADELAASSRALTTAALCAQMVGGAQRVLDMTVGYARERQQFGRAIGSFQSVQHHCADMAVDVLGARLITREAAWRLDQGGSTDEDVAVAKLWTSQAYHRVCTLGQQVHGAIGYTWEYDLHLYTRHAVDARLALGDERLQRERVADQLGLPHA